MLSVFRRDALSLRVITNSVGVNLRGSTRARTCLAPPATSCQLTCFQVSLISKVRPGGNMTNSGLRQGPTSNAPASHTYAGGCGLKCPAASYAGLANRRSRIHIHIGPQLLARQARGLRRHLLARDAAYNVQLLLLGLARICLEIQQAKRVSMESFA